MVEVLYIHLFIVYLQTEQIFNINNKQLLL